MPLTMSFAAHRRDEAVPDFCSWDEHGADDWNVETLPQADVSDASPDMTKWPVTKTFGFAILASSALWALIVGIACCTVL